MNSASSERREWIRSAILAAGISISLCLWGSGASMALAHGGGPLVLLFLPVVPVILLFGSGGPFEHVPEWLFNTLALSAEFAEVFLAVHAIRMRRGKRRREDI